MEGLDRPSLPYLVLAAAVLIGFGGVLTASFHLDDYAIFSDPVLTSGSGWWEVWRPMQTRPLTYFTYWMNHQLGGEDPVGYHALSLAIHLAAVLLLYDTLRRIVGPTPALIAAAIFGLLNLFVGWLLFGVIGVATLGLGFVLAFITRFIVDAILLKATDVFTRRLTIDSVGTVLVAAFMVSALGTLGHWLVGVVVA